MSPASVSTSYGPRLLDWPVPRGSRVTTRWSVARSVSRALYVLGIDAQPACAKNTTGPSPRSSQ